MSKSAALIVRRPFPWLRLLLLVVLAAVLAARLLDVDPLKRNGRDLRLSEGRFRVLEIVDPITFICQPIALAPSEPDSAIRIRLIGVALEDETFSAGSSADNPAWQLTREFIRCCPDAEVHLRFDKLRFDATETAVAYLYDVSLSRQLNQQLLMAGVVRLAPYHGAPSKWIKELQLAANQPGKITDRR